MKPAILTALLMTGTATAAADIPGIQNHPVQHLFTSQPCSAAISAIDNPDPDLIAVGEMAMAFGFIMGIEALNPGIRKDHETVLMRLRADCVTDSDETALNLLLR